MGGAFQFSVAVPLPACATTEVGAPGAVGPPPPPVPSAPLKTTVAISHGTPAPVVTPALGCSPMPTGRSSSTNSMSEAGETLTRSVKPLPAVRVLPKPEST
ncbi:hypothetical protein CLV40_11410 [Actinokineospora auranticolor]|uniref:Uncharacterized protein n=1 Tax=Actinokineospora auranticolor TaxID=155976 RepID=A0A2S6GJE6_9PSEU|nr:hypothetical protein CLV40_11410 [Actinokineospora auranticolor]